MAIRFSAIATIVASLTLAFGPQLAAGQETNITPRNGGNAFPEVFIHLTTSIDASDTCRTDVLNGNTDRGDRECQQDHCGWDGDICEVRETSTQCRAEGFGKCSCKQTLRIDSNDRQPPFPTGIDARCYPIAMEVACTSQGGASLHTLAAGKLCVLGDDPALKAFGPGHLNDHGRGTKKFVSEIRGTTVEERAAGESGEWFFLISDNPTL